MPERPDATDPPPSLAHEFSPERESQMHRLADLCNVLGDRGGVRVRICASLGTGPKFVGELSDITGLHSSGISQHLSKLVRAGVVNFERDAQKVYYKLNPNTGSEISQLVGSLLST